MKSKIAILALGTFSGLAVTQVPLRAQFVYVANFNSGNVAGFAIDPTTGTLTAISGSPFVAFAGSASVAVDPTGKFVYSSTRGANIITVFAADPAKGTLTVVDRTPTQGKTPRNFAIDPTGAYLFAANQDSDNVVVFRIDAKTGKLTPSGEILEAGNPVCIVFLPAQ